MYSFDDMRMAYNKSVNNFPNKEQSVNKMLHQLHKMKQEGDEEKWEAFCNNNKEMITQLSQDDSSYILTDLEMYCDWLGKNENKRD